MIAATTTSAASAENYIAKIYSVPPGGFVSGGATGGKEHAVIWATTPWSMVDLPHRVQPDSRQCGAIRAPSRHGAPSSTPTRLQAIAWHGSASTWINLHARLPYPYNLQWHSTAQGIDNLGNITGYIQHMTTNEQRPVLWVRQP